MDMSKYIGLPYERVDCWDLAKMFYRDNYSIDLSQVFDGVGPEDSQEREILIKSKKGVFDVVGKPLIGDLVVIKLNGFESHVGIYAGLNRVLHSLKGVGVICDNLNRYKHLVSGYYRHRELND